MNDDKAGVWSEKFKKQKELLDQQYVFPCDYLFKFIVPIEQEQKVRDLFPNHEPTVRPSNKGNYVSLTITYFADSSDLVLAIYEKASQIEGIISL